MKKTIQQMLPKMADQIDNGGIYTQSIRCGKATCKCERGETHTAFYFFYRMKGKLIKRYVRKAEVAEFSKLVEQAAFQRHQKRQAVKKSIELLKAFRASLWQNDALIKTIRGD